MRLEKDWFIAAAREIKNTLSELQVNKNKVIKEKFNTDFWKTKDGKLITSLKEKYNKSCHNPFLSFNIDSYRMTLSNAINYTIPSENMIYDKLKLKAVKFEDSDLLIEEVKKYFIDKLEKSYGK